MTAGNRARRLVAVLVVLCSVLLLAAGGPASADPTPTPTPTVPAACAGITYPAVHGEFIWCVKWANNDKDSTVTCANTATAADLQMCAATVLPREYSPDKPEKSVLGNKDGKVHCELWDDAIKAGNSPGGGGVKELEDRRLSCLSFREFLQSQVWRTAGTLPVECDSLNIPCQVGETVAKILAGGIRSGLQGLVDMIVQGEAFLLGELAKIVFHYTTFTPDAAFYWSYNQVAGVALGLAFLFFLLALIMNALKPNGPGPLATLFGLLRAVVGIFTAGGIAWLIVAAWDSVSAQLITNAGETPWDPGIWAKALTELSAGGGTVFIAVIVGILSIVGLILVFISLLFRNVLVTVSALFGAIVMSGQVMPATRHWAPRWFWTINALAMSRFMMQVLWEYGARATYGANNLTNVLVGLLIIWLMAACPAILMRTASLWDGYLADINSAAVVSAIGTASGIGDKLSERLDKATNKSDSPSPSGDSSSGSGDAVDLMASNTGDIPTTPGSDNDDGGPKPPSPGDLAEASDKAKAGVETNADGEKTGKPLETGGDDKAEAGPDDGTGGTEVAGDVNSQEATAVGDETAGAGDDLADGNLPTPGDSPTPPVPGPPMPGDNPAEALGGEEGGPGESMPQLPSDNPAAPDSGNSPTEPDSGDTPGEAPSALPSPSAEGEAPAMPGPTSESDSSASSTSSGGQAGPGTSGASGSGDAAAAGEIPPVVI